MERQRAKCWYNRSKFEQNTFNSQVGLMYITTPNASNAAVGGSLTQIATHCVFPLRIKDRYTLIEQSVYQHSLYRSICI